MTKILSFTLMLVFALQAMAFAVPNPDPGNPGMPDLKRVRELGNRGFGFEARVGTQLTEHKVQLAKGGFSVLKTGGASVVLPSTVLANLTDVDGKDLRLPYHAVIKQVLIDVLTTPTASASAGFTAPFLGLGLDTPGDLLAYTTPSALTGRVAGIPIGTAATMKKVGTGAGANQLGSVVKVNLKGGSVLTGNMNVFIEYYLSD